MFNFGLKGDFILLSKTTEWRIIKSEINKKLNNLRTNNYMPNVVPA